MDDGNDHDSLFFYAINQPVFFPERFPQGRFAVLGDHAAALGELRGLLEPADNPRYGQLRKNGGVLGNKGGDEFQVSEGLFSPDYFSSHRASRFLAS